MDIHSIFIEFGIVIVYEVDSSFSLGWWSDAVIRFRGHGHVRIQIRHFSSSAALVEMAANRK